VEHWINPARKVYLSRPTPIIMYLYEIYVQNEITILAIKYNFQVTTIYKNGMLEILRVGESVFLTN